MLIIEQLTPFAETRRTQESPVVGLGPVSQQWLDRNRRKCSGIQLG